MNEEHVVASELLGQDLGRRLGWIVRCATLLAGAVLLQAALAGQFMASTSSLIDAHRVVAEVIPLGALVLVVLAARVRRAARGLARLLWWSIAGLVLVVVQTGIGFAGRSSSSSAAVHIPLGVAVFGAFLTIALTAHVERSNVSVDAATGDGTSPVEAEGAGGRSGMARRIDK